jgi:hypothetical protein
LSTGTINTSNFIGYQAGQAVNNVNTSNFIGTAAGTGVSVNNSNFIGYNAGYSAFTASNSNFIGYQAGAYSSTASYSVFIGYQAGYTDAVNNNFNVGDGSSGSSILIGNYTNTGGYPNSIAIGKGTMNFASGSLNIGNAIYATNIYSGSASSSSPINGSYVGIGTNTPTQKLHVVGTITSSGLITPLSSSSIPNLTGSMFYSASKLFIYTGTGNAGGLVGWQTASLGG